MYWKKDNNCWTCHRDGNQVFCAQCGLGFHLLCASAWKENIKIDGYKSTLNVCKQCSKIDKSRQLHVMTSWWRRFPIMARKKLNDTLYSVLTEGIGVQPIPRIMRTPKEGDKFSNVSKFINFDTVEMKLKIFGYTCPEELLFDLRKIKHVMRIEFGGNEETSKISQYIRSLRPNFRQLDLCPHCIYNDYYGLQRRASLCPWFHRPILFDRSEGIDCQDDQIKAKLEKLPTLFPGKIIDLKPLDDMAYVRFFGIDGQLSIKVPVKNVYHLRKIDMDRCISQMDSLADESARENLAKAIEELKDYIENLKQEVENKWQFTNERQAFQFKDQIFIPKDMRKHRLVNASSRSLLNNSLNSNLAISEKEILYSNRTLIESVTNTTTFEKNRAPIPRTKITRKRSAQSSNFKNAKRSTMSLMSFFSEQENESSESELNKTLDNLQQKMDAIHACLTQILKRNS